MSNKVLIHKYFQNTPTLGIAKGLIGKVLCTNIEGKYTSGIIVETEAYLSENDKGNHAANGKTNRNRIMYNRGGSLYVYLCYGIHALFNIVTNVVGIPEAVLIRGILPLDGIDDIKLRRNKTKLSVKDTLGPGKITKALGINLEHNNSFLLENYIWVEDRNIQFNKQNIQNTSRIGIDFVGEDAKLPYRFAVDIEGIKIMKLTMIK